MQIPDVPLPDPADARPVSLCAMLAYADRHAPAVRVARTQLLRGEAAARGAAPLFPDNPQLSVGAGPRILADGTTVDLQASLQQRLEVAGERGLRLEVAERLQERLEAELDQVRWEVHRNVHAAFQDTLVARERAQAAERLLEFQEQLSEIASRRFEAGAVSPLVVRIAEGETAQARVSLIAAEQAYQAARLRLAELAGWPAENPPEPAETLDPPREAPPLDRTVEFAARQQPVLRTLAASIAEAEARVELADREAWPEPAIGVQVVREGAGAGSSGLGAASETVVLGTLSVPIPLWRRNQGDRAAARAELAIASAQANAFAQRLGARLARAKSAVDAAARRVAAYGEEILPSFEENLRLIRRAYELGEIDILEVSVARERFLRTQTQALDAYADYFRAAAELESAVGADLWPDEECEAQEQTPQERTGDEP